MAKLTKGTTTVESDDPTEITNLKARGFRTAEEQKRVDAAEAAQKAAKKPADTSTHRDSTDAPATGDKPAAGKSGK